MLLQEGLAAVFAGETEPSLSAREVNEARAKIDVFLHAATFPVAFACLFGDDAADAAGYEPLGLPHRAGFAVGLADVLERGIRPEEVLASGVKA
jgi:hypothetical protein